MKLEIILGPDLRKKLVSWVNDCQPPQSHVDKLLKLLTEEGIEGLPLTCRTLMNTNTHIKTLTFNSTTEVYYYDVLTTIVKNLERYNSELVKNLASLEIQLHYDGIPLFKSSSDTLWPLLLSFKNLVPTVVFPINLAMCSTKPEDVSYLSKSINELVVITNEGINIYGKNIPVVILNVVADAPARSLLKKVKGHTGYYCCGRCQEKGTWVEGRMVFLYTDDLVPRTDDDFRARAHETHHLPLALHGTSPMLPLPINMVTSFPQDYMHCACLGQLLKG